MIIGIDPGNTHSAGVVLTSSGEIRAFTYLPNREFLAWFTEWSGFTVICEMIASYGMPVGESVFETCVFIGELKARCQHMKRVTRIQVKSALCHSAKANDANVRQALIDIYGKPGTKKAPGGTYGISGDVWAALAVATAYRMGCKLYTPNSLPK